jgi:hypothetical protein
MFNLLLGTYQTEWEFIHLHDLCKIMNSVERKKNRNSRYLGHMYDQFSSIAIQAKTLQFWCCTF